MSARLSRRRFLLSSVMGAAAGGLALAGAPILGLPSVRAATPSPARTPGPTPAPTPNEPPAAAIVTFRSRPDVRPPLMTVTGDTDGDERLVFVTPRFAGAGEGVMAFDARGQLVWLQRVLGRTAVGLRPITWKGAPALAWWEGTIDHGLGDGEFIVVDDAYREVARFRTVVHPGDLHDLRLTPAGTAYAFAMDQVEREGRRIHDMLVQEIEVATGRRLWEWRASEHIGLDESVEPVPDEGAWDYAHLNSIDLGREGDLLVSARHTDTLYKVSRSTGDIVWRLGGAGSDFAIEPAAVFHAQHDARWQPDGEVSLFDNATKDPQDRSVSPRGLILAVDEEARTARLARELPPPRPVNSSSQGNVTLGRDGRATIGWGSANLVTSYDATGNVSWDAAMPEGFSSYRAYRARWRGRPRDVPIVSVGRDEAGTTTAWVSWNGATGVRRWELLAGGRRGALTPVRRVPRAGFESAVAVPDGSLVIAVRALDARGRVMATSGPVEVPGGDSSA